MARTGAGGAVEPREGSTRACTELTDAPVGTACALPVLEMAARLDSLQDLVADGLDDVLLHDRRLRIAIDRGRAADLYAQTVA